MTYLIAILTLLFGAPTDADLITAYIVRDRCEQYRGVVESNTEYWDLDTDLVLAVMAAESACLRTAKSYANSVGLMQVTPRHWTASEAELYNAATNIYYGMYILYSAIHHPEYNPEGSVVRGLAAYNCGWKSLNADRCIYPGGWDYSMEVILFWLPVIQGDL